MSVNASASFDFQLRTRMIFGAGVARDVGNLATSLGGRVLVVTDPGIVDAGHSARVCADIATAGAEVCLYDRVRENPSTADVEACTEFARDARVDVIVGLGGGSCLDTAKGCNFLLTNGGRMEDYWGVGKAHSPMLPLIAVPTTAGTGSETQSFALITSEASRQKMACGDPKAAPRIALLDPLLTLSMPREVTARTGLDTLAHAVETAVTRPRNALSQLYSRDAFLRVCRAFPLVLEHPDNVGARGEMLLAAAFAGIAIENSMLGAAHSMSNPLTAHFGIVHGQAVGITLPRVVEFNAAMDEAAERYRELALQAGIASAADSGPEAVRLLVARLESLLEAAGMPASLAECGITEASVDKLSEEAARQWTAQFNPRPVGPEEFRELFRSALKNPV